MPATVRRPGESEVDSASRRFGLSVLLAHEKLVLSALRLPAGVDGPQPHIHHEHSDGFYVLDGELEVLLEADWHPLRAGSLVVIPPEVVHTVRNTSADSAFALNLHAPGAGFDAYVQAGRDGDDEARARFDQAPPPEDGGRPGSLATLTQPARFDGPALSIAERALTFGSSPRGEDAAVALYVLDTGTSVLIPPGEAWTADGDARVLELIAR